MVCGTRHLHRLWRIALGHQGEDGTVGRLGAETSPEVETLDDHHQGDDGGCQQRNHHDSTFDYDPQQVMARIDDDGQEIGHILPLAAAGASSRLMGVQHVTIAFDAACGSLACPRLHVVHRLDAFIALPSRQSGCRRRHRQ